MVGGPWLLRVFRPLLPLSISRNPPPLPLPRGPSCFSHSYLTLVISRRGKTKFPSFIVGPPPLFGRPTLEAYFLVRGRARDRFRRVCRLRGDCSAERTRAEFGVRRRARLENFRTVRGTLAREEIFRAR